MSLDLVTFYQMWLLLSENTDRISENLLTRTFIRLNGQEIRESESIRILVMAKLRIPEFFSQFGAEI